MEKKPSSGDVRKPVPSRKRFPKSSTKADGATTASQASSSSAGSSLASSRVSTPSISQTNTNSNYVSAAASSSSSSAALTVSETHLKYQYSRKELLQIRDSPLAKAKPTGLSPDHEVDDGQWDPDLWISSFTTSASESGSQPAPPREKRKTQAETDTSSRKRPTGNTSKADNGACEDEDEHIILGPQRGSFGTGCQVKRTTSTNEPVLKRDRPDRVKDTSRIGSGRIQISDRPVERSATERGSHERDDAKGGFDRRRPDRVEMEEGSRMRYTREESYSSSRYGREDSYRTGSNYERDDGRGNKGRFDRDRESVPDRVFERRKDPNMKTKPEYSERRDRDREYDDRRSGAVNKSTNRYSTRDGYSDHVSGGGYNRNQAEPEWFTNGPKHQWDTIELGGFDGPKKDRSELSKSPVDENDERTRRTGRRGSKDSGSGESSNRKSDSGKKSGESDKGKNAKPRKESVKIKEREEQEMDAKETNADGEKKKSLSETNNMTETSNVTSRNGPIDSDSLAPSNAVVERPPQPASEFDFNMLFSNDNSDPFKMWNPSNTAGANAGSRFQQWFPHSADGHLSPRNDTTNNGVPMFSLFGRGSSPSSNGSINSMNIMDILHKADSDIPDLPSIYHRLASHDSPTPCQVDVSANVKALMDSVQASIAQPVLPTGGKVLMAEDLEASLLSPTKVVSKSSSSGGIESSPSDSRFYKARGPAARLSSPASSHHGPIHGNKPTGPAPALPAGARITTVEELEAGLRDVQVAPPSGDQPQQVTQHDNQPADMSAFQKLLGLVGRDEIIAEANAGPADHIQQPPPPPPADVVQLQVNQTQPIVQEPTRQPQQSVPIQKLFSQPQMQQMHSQPPMFGLVQPPIMSTSHPPPAYHHGANMLHNALLQPSVSPHLLPQLSPHASSPIMFGSQPPHNITAPMPIHSSQRPPFGPVPTSMSQFAHVMNQPPSSQDAMQVYLQSLLKQMDDQRQLQMMQQVDSRMQFPANSQQPQSSVNSKMNLQSIPTAVIRKMASMKADEKSAKEAAELSAVGTRPGSNRDSIQADGSAVSVPMDKGLAANGSVLGGYGTMMPDPGTVSPGYHQLGAASAANYDQGKNGRRLVGQGLMFQGPGPTGMEYMQQQQQHMRAPVSMLNQTMAAPSSGRPIVKVGQQLPFGFASGAPPRTNGTLTAEQMQVLQLRNNPRMMLQQQLQQQQLQQQLQQQQQQIQQQQQQQQRTVNSLQQPPAGADSFVGNLQLTQQQQQHLATALLLQRLQKAPPPAGNNYGAPPPGPAPNRMMMKPSNGGDAIARWFSPDLVSDRRLPNMPGQRVMTLDEIECAASPTAN